MLSKETKNKDESIGERLLRNMSRIRFKDEDIPFYTLVPKYTEIIQAALDNNVFKKRGRIRIIVPDIDLNNLRSILNKNIKKIGKSKEIRACKRGDGVWLFNPEKAKDFGIHISSKMKTSQ